MLPLLITNSSMMILGEYLIEVTLLAAVLVWGLISAIGWANRIKQRNRSVDETNTRLQAEIDRRKESEARLRQREEVLRVIMDNIPQYIFWKDVDSVYRGCNKKFARDFGVIDPDKVVGKKDSDIEDDPVTARSFLEEDRQVLYSGRAQFEMESQITLPNGKHIWIKKTKVPLKDDDGNIFGLLGTCEDITDRKRDEEALRTYSAELAELVEERTQEIKAQKTQIEQLVDQLRTKNGALEELVNARTQNLNISNTELKRSNHALKQFAYIASHDLQEPLRMVGSFVQLIERRYGHLLDAKGKEYIQYSIEGVTRMSQLIRNLLSYSDAGHPDSAYCQVNIQEVVCKRIGELENTIKNRGAEIFMTGLDEQIDCEPNQIGLVFTQLLSNALKFNEASQPVIHVRCQSTPTHWLFSVQDNGIGIEDHYQEKIFEIFKRLNRRDEFKGNGIGLALCEKIIARHQGKIWYEAAPEGGTIFHFTISKQLEVGPGPAYSAERQ